MKPVTISRVSQKFAAPDGYASSADAHGSKGHHTGTDFGSAWPIPISGRVVKSVLPGLCVISEFNDTMGNWVGLYNRERDLLVTYWHMSVRLIDEGKMAGLWLPVGKVGSTGNSTAAHLHVQVNKGRDFDYSGHINPAIAFKVYSLQEGRAAAKRRKKGGR